MAFEFANARNADHMGPMAMTVGAGTGQFVISVADEFSRYPGGRFRADGDASGEEFRDDYLLPKLRDARDSSGQVTVRLDGVAGYPASFLEEAFGGLVRAGYFSKNDLRSLLKVEAGILFGTYEMLIWKYIDEARAPK